MKEADISGTTITKNTSMYAQLGYLVVVCVNTLCSYIVLFTRNSLNRSISFPVYKIWCLNEKLHLDIAYIINRQPVN